MRPRGAVEIDIDESFEQLRNAPIVEAIIEFRGRVQIAWDENEIKQMFLSRLQDTDYEYLDSIQEVSQRLTFTEDPGEKIVAWKGLRFKSKLGPQIVQFSRNSFVFSWLKPYESWEQFQKEALELWAIYKDVTKIEDISRIGVRFINLLQCPKTAESVSLYLKSSPNPPNDLPIEPEQFVHVDTFRVPGHDYHVKISTTQKENTLDADMLRLILDVDVFTSNVGKSSDEVLTRRLQEMRWLKNKAFLGSVTGDAMKIMQGDG